VSCGKDTRRSGPVPPRGTLNQFWGPQVVFEHGSELDDTGNVFQARWSHFHASMLCVPFVIHHAKQAGAPLF
jgi:hypothetical protein